MNSHLTAMARKTLPVPVRWLLKQGMIHGQVLDYGCGRCAEVNQTMLRWRLPEITSVISYDPHYAPDTLKFPKTIFDYYFDVILCTYVLCTISKAESKKVLLDIQSRLWPTTGVAYISVRADKPQQGYGVSSHGTYQRDVRLDMPLVYETKQYRIYRLTSDMEMI